LSDDEFYDVKQTSDSGFIACGYYPRLGMGDDLYVVKTNVNGDTLWTRVLGSTNYDIARSVAQTSDGGYVFAGQMDSTGIVIRLDAQGDTIWAIRLYDAGYVSLYSVAETADSGFVTTGVLNTFSGNQVYIARVDKNGALLWEKNYGYAGADYGFSIKSLTGGSFVVGGYSWQTVNDYDSYLLKLDENGDTVWTKVYDAPRESGIVEIALCPDGGFAFAEAKNVLGMSYQFSILRVDSSGYFLWRKEYGGVGADYINGIATCSNGDYIICGMATSNPLVQLYLVKTDENGSVISTMLVENNQIDINIYPNPFREYINIDLSEFTRNESYQIRIYNGLGQPILSQILAGGSVQSISTPPLSSGIYIMQISNKGKILKTFSLTHL
jgi:hypothetical protein